MARKTFRKQITSPELVSKIKEENKKLVARFLKEKNTRCSDGTITGYKSDLDIFFVWNLQHNDNKFFVDIKKIEFSDFFSFCVSELQWGSARFGRMKSCLSTLSEFIVKYYDEEYKDFRNVILKAIESMPKNPVREKTILSEDQVNGLLNHLFNEVERSQEACFLALAIGCGARLSELTRFTTDLIDEKNTAFNDIFLETTKKIKTKGRGKAGKPLNKYIIKDLFLPYYNDWLVKRKAILDKYELEDHGYIFITRDGRPASNNTVKGWTAKWEKYLGVDFYVHCCRHYITTHLTRLGLDTELIVEIMGWSSADMYKIYNDLSVKDREWKGLDKLKESLEAKE